jgi:hypothetical protein
MTASLGGDLVKDVLRRVVAPLLITPIGQSSRRIYRRVRLERHRRKLISKPTNPGFVDVLYDASFRASVKEVSDLTPADTAILAHLWQLCRVSDPEGIIVEVGAYKGGTALHLSNARPTAKIVVCDTFNGFCGLPMDPVFDRREVEWRSAHDRGPFEDTSSAAVRALFETRGRNAVILEGRFPQSDTEACIHDVSFAHIDVTLFESCRATLEYLAPRSRPSAIWVIDSYLRNTDGVDRAVDSFIAMNSDWVNFPIYPGQAVVFNRHRAGAAGEG